MVQQVRRWSTLRQWQHAIGVLARLDSNESACVVSDGPDLIVAWGLDEVVAPDHVEDLRTAIDGLTPGWWAGFIGFEAGASTEPTFDPLPTDTNIPGLWLGRFRHRERVIRDADEAASPIDHESLPERNAEHGRHGRHVPPWELLSSSLNRQQYCDAVSDLLERLKAGECFEVNLTRRLTFAARIDPVALLQQLATRHPAPHAAFLRTERFSLVSPSPELLATWQDGRIETRPIKGTNRDPDELINSVKDRTENIITVDLARADISKIAVPDSLAVSGLCELEEHPGLWHLVSTVEAEIDSGASLGEVLAALLPAASITGAPKPRVLSIIRALEPVRRNAYCGSIGFLDTVEGRGALNVAIRTFTHTATETMLGVGGGITLASVPELEWQETELKADRLLRYAEMAWESQQ
ncbi:MAG: anthranilate synthase component I family protein [Acidimicrobiia bacterium]